jgi:1,4-dihydroxy-2-naphthoate octaprenyltransferase
VSFLVPVALAIGGRGIAVLLPVLAVPLARPLLRTVRTFSEPRQLNLVLKGTARLALIFGLLFGVGLAIESVVG